MRSSLKRSVGSLRTVIFFVAAVLFTAPASGENTWKRSMGSNKSRAERDTLVSIERTLTGRGTERDLLRVRVALITLSKGDMEDHRSAVLLMRLRRELGFSIGRRSEGQLVRALSGDIGHTMRAWAYLELAHLSFRRGDLSAALGHIDSCLDHAWRTDVREEATIYQGWLFLRSGDAEAAEAKFLSVERQTSSRRVLVQAKVGRALSEAQKGNLDQFEALSRQAIEIESRRASVSERDSSWELELDEFERRAVQLVMTWRFEQPKQDEPGEIPPACALLISKGEIEEGKQVKEGEILRSLGRLLREPCQNSL